MIYLIEDHDEALRIWREKKIKGIDLVHIDAHIDFGFYAVKTKNQIIKEAKTLTQLKQELEKSLLYQRYQRDFDKQTNIGNYIYQAMREGIVRDFYWVVPGGLKEFKKSFKIIKGMLKNFAKHDPHQSCRTLHATRRTLNNGMISTRLFGRKFVTCILEKLSILKQRVLLDIDTDFLVFNSILDTNATANISKRMPWIRPDRLVKDLLISKNLKPFVTTIAYSVNGGYTPMRYKVLGDELAYHLSPRHFKERYRQKFIASSVFRRFESTGKRRYYQKAVRLDPSYGAADNNYGPLYLSIRKFSKAQKEFLKVAKVDPKKPYPFIGLGNIALEKMDFHKAKKYFSYALKQKKNLPSALFGLAQVEFRLKNFKKAKDLFNRYRAIQPLQPQSYYFLGRIYEREGNLEKAAVSYQDAMRLRLNNIDVISRLLKISCYVKAKDDIIEYALVKYGELKRQFNKTRRLDLRHTRKTRGLGRIEKKMAVLDRRLKKIVKGGVGNERIHSFTQEQGYGDKGD
ncbi:MAG: UPF0489 family protein [Candidatus Omnitrophica bacterium]|nr:UPF0489 family protein [Candidatus Omnitrophota bacterium]